MSSFQGRSVPESGKGEAKDGLEMSPVRGGGGGGVRMNEEEKRRETKMG